MPADPDTIAAIATARGRAALAVIRVSGPQAHALVNERFRGDDLTNVASHTAHVGYVVDAEGEALDQVVATVFQGPRSATGEDVVEVSCHGGDLAPQLVLDALLEAGARMAEPGEFTERAFLNGKLDLAQAEAVADLIHASSEQAHRVSMQHLRGRYSDRLSNLREELLDLCALMELEIDFSEEDVEFADRERLTTLLDTAQRLVSTLLDSYRTGELLRDGVRVVIGGRPNAGKSTLLNALVGRDRAIVSATPGTTRDEIEAEAELDGLLFRFVDTAGLRDTSNQIEAEGVRRAEASIREADVLLYVYDQQRGLDNDERTFLQELSDAEPSVPTVVVANKSDMVATEHTPDLDVGHALSFSALRAFDEAEELDRLTTALLDQVDADLRDTEASAVVMNKRHRQHLQEAQAALERAQSAYEQGVSSDLLTLDLREALHALGAITGEVTNEDVLGQIFSQFCIGK